MFLDDLSDILSTGGLARPIYKLHLPALAQDSAVLLTPLGGQPTVQTMAAGAPSSFFVQRPRARITARDQDYSVARTVAHIAFRLLDGYRSTVVNGIPYLWMAATSSPRYLGTDENGRSLIGFDVDAMTQLSPAFAGNAFAGNAFAEGF